METNNLLKSYSQGQTSTWSNRFLLLSAVLAFVPWSTFHKSPCSGGIGLVISINTFLWSDNCSIVKVDKQARATLKVTCESEILEQHCSQCTGCIQYGNNTDSQGHTEDNKAGVLHRHRQYSCQRNELGNNQTPLERENMESLAVIDSV